MVLKRRGTFATNLDQTFTFMLELVLSLCALPPLLNIFSICIIMLIMLFDSDDGYHVSADIQLSVVQVRYYFENCLVICNLAFFWLPRTDDILIV